MPSEAATLSLPPLPGDSASWCRPRAPLALFLSMLCLPFSSTPFLSEICQHIDTLLLTSDPQQPFWDGRAADDFHYPFCPIQFCSLPAEACLFSSTASPRDSAFLYGSTQGSLSLETLWPTRQVLR